MLTNARSTKKFLFLVPLLFTNLSLASKAVIWDVGWTLVKGNKSKFLQCIGLNWGIPLYLKHGSKIDKFILGSLAKLFENSEVKNSEFNGLNKNLDTETRIPDKKVFPKELCDWMTGRLSTKEIKAMALEKCRNRKNLKKGEIKFLESAAEYTFDPGSFAKGMMPIRKMVRILEECAKVKNSSGIPANSMYILSNWDKESFEAMSKLSKKRCIFRHFDKKNIFISGEIHKLKPKPEIYEYFLKACKLDPKDCVFIDDQEENLKTARELGMETINPNIGHKAVRERLQKLGVLQKTKSYGKLKAMKKRAVRLKNQENLKLWEDKQVSNAFWHNL